MNPLDVSYSVWKQLVEDNEWGTYYSDGGPTRAYLWTGDRDHLYASQANGAEYTDWETNFKDDATEVVKDDDAVAKIIGLAGLAPTPLAPGGVPVYMAAGPPPRFALWTPNQTISKTDWTEVYSLESQGALHGAFWQLSTYKMYLRVQMDSIIVVDLDLEEVKKDFGFTCSGSGSGGDMCLDWLSEYKNNRWQFRPPGNPARFDVHFKVLLKAKQNNKKLHRGLVVWRAL